MLLRADRCVGSRLEGEQRVALERQHAAHAAPVGGLCDLLALLRLRDGELLVDEARGHPKPDLFNERAEDGRRLRQVLGLLTVEADVGDALVLAEVEDAQRADEVAPEGGRQRLAVGDGEIVPDVVVRLALRVAAAARVGSQRLAEDRLGDLLVAVAGQPLIEVRTGGLLRGDEVDARAVRDDARRVGADLDEGSHERRLVAVARSRRVLAQPERQTVDLSEADPVLQVVVLEEVHPRHNSEDASPRGVTAASLVPVNDELVRREQDALRHVLRSHLERIVQRVPKEAFLVSRLDVLHHDVPFVIAPQDLGYGEALADCVEQVILHILEALDAVELLFDEVGDLLVQRFVAEGNHLEVKARDGVLARLELAE